MIGEPAIIHLDAVVNRAGVWHLAPQLMQRQRSAAPYRAAA